MAFDVRAASHAPATLQRQRQMLGRIEAAA
jgi:hypothetical protein